MAQKSLYPLERKPRDEPGRYVPVYDQRFTGLAGVSDEMNPGAKVRSTSPAEAIARITRPRLATFVPIALVGLLVFFINRDPSTEQGVFLAQHQPYADYITGGGPRDVVSYPIWGYPAVIAFLGDVPRMVLQYVLSLVVILMLIPQFRRSKPIGLPGASIIAVASIPWFAIASLNSASAIALPLIWLAILLLLNHLGGVPGYKRALLAGVMIGIALNFRSEFLALPLLLSIGILVLPAFRSRSLVPMKRSIWPAIILTVVAWSSLSPWAVFTQVKADELNVTSTNGGAVAYITLGQLPGNPWGIVHEDYQAQRTLSGLGHDDVNPYSPEGNDILMSLFLDSIRAQPGAYARKVVHNTRNALVGGLYFGDWDGWIPGTDPVQIDVVKEKFKNRTGINPNPSQIAWYRESGLWEEGAGFDEIAVVTVAGVFAVGTDLLILMAIITAGITLLRRRLTAGQLIALLVFAYVLASVAFLQYQPRHMNTAWPAMMMFASTALMGILGWSRRRLQ